MIEFKQIPRKELNEGRLYLGRGSGNHVGLWDGEVFTTICYYPTSWAELQAMKSGRTVTKEMKKSRVVIKHEYYYYHDYADMEKDIGLADIDVIGLGTFQPFCELDIGKIIRGNHRAPYGECLRFEGAS